MGGEIGTDLKITLSAAQLTSGLVTPILDDTELDLPHLEDGVILHLRSTLKKLNGNLHIEKVWTPSLQREGDKSIMEVFARIPTSKKASATKLKRIMRNANTCRLYLRVITIADLANLDGTTIDSDRLKGKWRASSKLVWPRQCAPTKSQWDDFRWALRRTICTTNGNLHHPFKLDAPLGEWLQTPRHTIYNAYRDDINLYCHAMYDEEATTPLDKYKMRILEGRTDFQRVEDEEVNELPPETHPVEAQHADDNTAVALQEYAIKQVDEQQSTTPYYTIENRQALDSADKLFVASDGSHDPITGNAAYAWVITTEDRSGEIRGSQPVRANPKNMTSYRAELAGVHKLLVALVDTGLNEKEIELGCDNKSALDRSNTPEQSLDDMTAAEGDLLKVIKDTLPKFSNIALQHVRGHQDRTKSYENLPLQAQLNVDCDKAAKETMREQSQPATRPEPIEGTGATLYLNNNMITTDINSEIANAAHGNNMKDYLKERHEWTETELNQINWKALGDAKRRQPRQQSQRTSKLLNGWLPVGHNLMKYGKEGVCPSCGADDETILHLFRCKDDRMRETLKEAIDKAETKLGKANVPTTTYKHFFDMYRDTCQLKGQHHEVECEHAATARQIQETLGEEAILRGYLTSHWTYAINARWRAPQCHPGDDAPPKQRSPYQMGVLLQETVWDIFEELWTKRNEILHGPNSHVEKAETSTATRRLLHYKRHSNDLLSPSAQHQINFPELTIINWSSKRKKDQLRVLDKLHRHWQRDRRLRKAGQKRIYEMNGWHAYDPHPPDPGEEEENPPNPPPDPGEEEVNPPDLEAEEENGTPIPPDSEGEEGHGYLV